jgi:hypothetical protein
VAAPKTSVRRSQHFTAVVEASSAMPTTDRALRRLSRTDERVIDLTPVLHLHWPNRES